MTGLELKQVIKELNKKHSNFDKMEVVLLGDADYVSEIRHIKVLGLKRETKEENPDWEGNYRCPYEDEKPDKKFIVTSF